MLILSQIVAPTEGRESRAMSVVCDVCGCVFGQSMSTSLRVVERQNGQGSVPPGESFHQLETVYPTLFMSTLTSTTYPRRRPTAADNKDVVCLSWSVGRGDQ